MHQQASNSKWTIAPTQRRQKHQNLNCQIKLKENLENGSLTMETLTLAMELMIAVMCWEFIVNLIHNVLVAWV